MFFALALNEIFEEILEEMIAFGFSWIIGKVLNLLLLVTLTQGTKILIKKIVKSITHKEGNDKMVKVKNFFAKFKKTITENIVWSNKLTISGMISTLFMILEGTDVINVISTLPQLSIYGFNIMPYLVYAILGVLSLFGIGKEGFESVKTYLTRIQEKNNVKTEKSAEKEYKKEILATKKELIAKQEANYNAQAKALVDAKRASNK